MSAREVASGGTIASSAPFRFAINTTVASSRRDRLTGVRGQADTFLLPARDRSLLPNYDTITNYESVDRLRLSGTIFLQSIRNVSGSPITSLSPALINQAVGGQDFAPGSAAAFKVRGLNGTMIALNDRRPGFQSGTDSLLFLQDFDISRPGNVVAVV